MGTEEKILWLGISLVFIAVGIKMVNPFDDLTNWVLWAIFYFSGIIIGVPIQLLVGRTKKESRQ